MAVSKLKEIDWNEVMHISRWYIWKHLKRYSRILGSSDIVSETMLQLVKTDDKKWNEMSLTTIVCNNTRWAACKLYRQHKKHSRLNGHMAFPRESYDVDFDKGVFSEEFRKIVALAKTTVISNIKKNTIAKHPAAIRDKLKKIARYESGFIELRIAEQETLDTLAYRFDITRERARQIDFKFWNEIRNAIVHIYKLPLDHVASLLIEGEFTEESEKNVCLLRKD